MTTRRGIGPDRRLPPEAERADLTPNELKMVNQTKPRAAEIPCEPAVVAGLAPPTATEIKAQLGGYRSKRVAVALSGGLDSAVAAWALKEAGADVIGLSLRLHDPDPRLPLAPRACCPPEDLQDARRVAERLGIPFYVVDGRDGFERHVVEPFVGAYLKGQTPNPCVGCNSFVKLARLVERARVLGCAGLATGHYARLGRDAKGVHLFQGEDASKDQSYFLFALSPPVLERLIFPLGGMTKSDVRGRAVEAGLPVTHKLESQEVCFVGGRGAGAYVMGRPEAQGAHEGPIVDRRGQVLGRHRGVMHFTIGQRRGLGIAHPQPLHVLEIDAAKKTLVVGGAADLEKRGLVASRVSFFHGFPVGPVQARIRYRDPGAPATLHRLARDGDVEVRFATAVRAVAPGQAVVFFSGAEVLGGGWISEACA